MTSNKIENNVKLGKNCLVEDYCMIGHATKKQTTGKDITLFSPDIKKFIISDGVVIGDNSVIRSHSVIYDNVKIGDNFKTGHFVLIREHTTIGKNVTIGTGSVVDGYVSIGDNSQIQSNCYISQSSVIGRGVFIAPSVSFYDNKKIILDVLNDLKGPVIGNYVRIGGGSVVLPSVKIGKNSIIGAGSVVTKSVPENSLAYGNPARVIRKLDDSEIIAYLDSIKEG